jgi:spoIIIJ-associated protein
MIEDVNSVEVTARSLDAAVRQALERLGAQEDEVIIEILASPRAGLLGLGARPARVRVTRRTDHAVSIDRSAAEPAASATRKPSAAGDEVLRRGETNLRQEEASHEPDSTASSALMSDDLLEPSGAVSINANVQVSSKHVEMTSPAEQPPEPKPGKPLHEQRQEALNLLNEILTLMGEQMQTTAISAKEEAGENAAIEINLETENKGLLIGRRGQTLEALEYVVNRIMARRVENPVPVLLDVESYHARRSQRLVRLALALGEQVKRQRKALRLKPMPPRERRVIHRTLRDDPLLMTESSGSGYLRAIKIFPASEPSHSAPSSRGRI